VKPLQLLISCGEASGDLYAAELLKELAKKRPSVSAFGLAGDKSRAAGMECIVRLEEVSVIGLVEVVRKLPAISNAMHRLCEAAATRRPEIAVLIDFSGFNLRLARRLKSLGVRVVYYVSPQVWAWRRRRIRAIRELVEEMLVILPFEKDFYEREGVNVHYVGHPLVDLVHATESRESFFARLGLDRERPLLMVLPGSRCREVELHLPVLRQAIDELSRTKPELQFLVSRAPTIPPGFLLERIGPSTDRVRILEGPVYEGLAHSTAAIVASGTATVEAAISGTPMVVVYRTGRTTYFLGKPFVDVPFYSMVNLIAERELVPELIQDEMTAANIVAHVSPLLEERGAEAMRRGLVEVKDKLGGGGASARAAEAVLARFELS
jgi:lipid-A-disaccharide synthase